jgi:hypothetical protein
MLVCMQLMLAPLQLKLAHLQLMLVCAQLKHLEPIELHGLRNLHGLLESVGVVRCVS